MLNSAEAALPRDRSGNPLCVLTVHAHPDDESSKGAQTIAKCHDAGIKTVLVCCTGGELGDIANPAMNLPGVLENLAAIRSDELAKATQIIGFEEVVMLGYKDSGMAESEANNDPDCFHQADLDEAVGRLVREIRKYRPQVILTYGDNQQGYPHPDHIRVHEISLVAFDRAGDAGWYPEFGEPWQASKMYYSTWAKARMMTTHDKMLELGLKSPYDERWLTRPSEDHRITTRIEVGQYYDVRVNALLAHATQIDPTSPFWFGLPHDVARTIHPFEDYILARSVLKDVPAPGDSKGDSSVGSPVVSAELDADRIYETDLFDGISAETSDDAVRLVSGHV